MWMKDSKSREDRKIRCKETAHFETKNDFAKNVSHSSNLRLLLSGKCSKETKQIFKALEIDKKKK